ncbi:hypothetical protein HPP92_020093 [Vanilla planifolia]|uniref:EF-hand domain-containing protein n=1 Tax=Vanilla planifolia TaxID=51239 RepID=A0A835Q6K7_VANPL|nr:hypothetical protein HPP92_020093 [Vanilla planifolia]
MVDCYLLPSPPTETSSLSLILSFFHQSKIYITSRARPPSKRSSLESVTNPLILSTFDSWVIRRSMAALDENGKSSRHALFSRIRNLLSPLKKPKRPSPPPMPPALATPESEFERVFRYFDEDGDGRVSAAELCSCLKSAGEEVSPAGAEAVVESSDSDGDGKLGYEDFLRLVDAEGEEDRGRALREAFAAYEMEGRGCITARSLRLRLRRLGEEKTMEECRDMIRKFDVNGDGVLSFDEFKRMML